MQKITKTRLILTGICLILAISLTGTFAFEQFGQGALNVVWDGETDSTPDEEDHFEITITVLKRETDLEGNHMEIPVSDAGFVLYNVETDEQILLGGEALLITDSDGQIVFNLPVGNYVLREHNFPNGFGPEIDTNGDSITSWYFTIHKNEETGELELIVDDEVVEAGMITILNRRLSNDLIVEKTVVNADNSSLTDAQRIQEFEFNVTFSYDGAHINDEFNFVIYEGEALYDDVIRTITSGESFFLRHNQRAVFSRIPIGAEYHVTELAAADSVTSGTNAQGVIKEGEINQIAFTNTYKDDDEPEPRYGSLLICKEVRGEGADLDREFKFVVAIDDEHYELMLSHGECRLFENISVGTRYTVYEYDYSEEDYWVNITTRTGYITEWDIEILFINRFNDCLLCPTDDNGNLEIGKTVIPVEAGEIDTDQLFDFTLTLSHLSEEEIEILINGEMHVISWPTQTFDFQLRHGEVFRIEGLPQGVRYNVTEQGASEFIQEVTAESGMVFGNETMYIQFYNEMKPVDELPEYTSIRICKVLENEDLDFPNDTLFNFVLNINRETHARFELTAGECRVFEDLEVGAEFEVLEVDIPQRYVLVSSGTSSGTLIEEEIVVTFVNRDTFKEIPVEKHWELNGWDIELPDYTTIHLLAGDTVVDVVQLMPDENGRWEYTFTVPKYEEGEPIVYNVVVIPLPGWHEVVNVTNGRVTITSTVITPIHIELEIEKQIEGAAPITDKTFEFILRGIDHAPMPEQSQVAITGIGTANFGEIRFTESGIFEYTIHEVMPADTGNFTFDTTVYQIVVIINEVNGVLEIDKTILSAEVEVDEVIFVNHYSDDENNHQLPPDDENKTDNENKTDDKNNNQPSPQSRPPQTGDTTQLNFWLVMIILSGVSLVLQILGRYVKSKR